MPDHVPGNVQHCRASRLEEIGRRLRRAYFERLAGHRLQVLVETALTDRPGWLLGTSDRYAPVELPGGPELVGQLVDVVAGPVVGDRIRGR
jgi:tRNA A37 methylthiotransferase MiaB